MPREQKEPAWFMNIHTSKYYEVLSILLAPPKKNQKNMFSVEDTDLKPRKNVVIWILFERDADEH